MVDTARIYIKAGDGGDGIVHFKREKYRPKGGPDGGDGGKGGDIYLETCKELATLQQFAHKQKFEAQDGKSGRGRLMTGISGEDIVIKVPVGTVVKWEEEGKEQLMDLTMAGEKKLVVKGGKGGRGNFRFKSSVNTTPREAEKGERGEEKWLEMELKLLADVGVIGLPNVGKSTFLSIVSKAKPKIADYEFTTLEPNLGVMSGKFDNKQQSLVIADIPGLIKGASKGKGLGDKFLRHVERTKILVHILAVKSGEELDKKDKLEERLYESYKTIRKELKDYDEGLVKKKEIVVLNKIDLLGQKQVQNVINYFGKKSIDLKAISCGNLKGVRELQASIFRSFKS